MIGIWEYRRRVPRIGPIGLIRLFLPLQPVKYLTVVPHICASSCALTGLASMSGSSCLEGHQETQDEHHDFGQSRCR